MTLLQQWVDGLQGRPLGHRAILVVVLGILIGLVSSALWGIVAGMAIATLIVVPNLSMAARLTVAVSVFVYAANFENTESHERSIDPASHIFYLEHLYLHLRAPLGSDCLVCHHPALYHILAGVWFWVLGATQVMEAVNGAQFFAVPCMLAFSLAGASVIERFTKQTRLIVLGTALCALWPYSIIMSARIHNDVLVSALMAWTVYASVRFYETATLRWLVWSLVLALVSVFTKMSGILALVSVFAVVALVAIKAKRGNPGISQWGGIDIGTFRRFAGLCLVALALVLGYLAVRDASRCKTNVDGKCLVDSRHSGVASRVLGSATSVSENKRLRSGFLSYVSVDVRDLVSDPYAISTPKGNGEDLFWNHFLKSAQFSTYNDFPDGETTYPENRLIAQFMMVILLFICTFTAAGFLVQARRNIVKLAPVLFFFVICVAGAVAFRMIKSTSHHADFRHVFPVLIPSIVFFVVAVEGLQRRWNPLAVVAQVVVGIYCLASIVYFIPKSTWFVETVEVSTVSRSWESLACDDETTQKAIELGWEQNLRIERDAPSPFGHVELMLNPPGSYKVELRGTTGSVTIEVPGSAKRVNTDTVKLHKPNASALGELKSVLVKPVLVGATYAVSCVRLVKPASH